jgi:hypothetical protein
MPSAMGDRISRDDDERRALAHCLMEEALALLDRTGDSLPAIHLDHAVCALGLREPRAADAVQLAHHALLDHSAANLGGS